MSTNNRSNKHIIMHKVPPLLRYDNKSSKDVFDPHLVSIGPYHHGKPELQLAENLKPRAVQMFVEGSKNDKEFYLNKVLETINDLRSCYVKGSTDGYDDVYLANMMLQDACFLFKFGEMSKDPTTIYQVGRYLFEYVFHDITLLENQIPLFFLKLLNYSTSDDNSGGTLLDDLIINHFDGNWDHLKSELDPEDKPIHLLDLTRILAYLPDKASLNHTKSSHSNSAKWLTSKFPKSCKNNNNVDEAMAIDIEEHWCVNSFRSAMDLKASGIHFKVNPTTKGYYRLEDIKFKSTRFYGKLQLPKWNVTIFTKVYLSNTIALENYLPGEECFVSAYVNIMKILLQTTRDVRELREKHVLFNQLRSDEELLQVFLDLPVTSWDTLPPFSDVLDELEVYYGKNTNKWMAELIQTYFRSPWTTIALIAAAFLLCLTMIQAYFAVNPRTP